MSSFFVPSPAILGKTAFIPVLSFKFYILLANVLYYL